MDPSIEQEAQMIIDTLTLAEENRENAIRSVVTLQSFGVESYVSLTIIDDADLFDHERAGSYFAMVELIDSSGKSRRPIC